MIKNKLLPKDFENYILETKYVPRVSALKLSTFKRMLDDNNFKQKPIVYCNSQKVLRSYLVKNKLKPIFINFMMDLDCIMSEINDYCSSDNNRVLVISDEMIFNLIFAIKTVSVISPYCKFPNELIMDKSSKFYEDFSCKSTLKSINEMREILNVDGNKTADDPDMGDVKSLMNVYSKFMIHIFMNVVTYVNDQTIMECPKTEDIPSDKLYESVANKISSVINLWTPGINGYNNADEIIIDFNDSEIPTVESFVNISKMFTEDMNLFLNNFMIFILQISKCNFSTLNCGLASAKNSNILLNPEIFANSKLISDICNYYNCSDAEDFYYYCKYGLVSSATFNNEIVTETIDFDEIGTSASVINNFKFPNGIYRDKQSMNIFTNIILDLITKN